MIRALMALFLLFPVTNLAADSAPPEDPGLPALSREWHGADYQLVSDALSRGTLPLPRLSSQTGAALLKRLTAPENLTFQKNRTLPVESRLQDFLAMQAAAGMIAKRFFEAVNRGEPLHTELASLLGFMIRMAASGADLLTEFIPSIPKDDNYRIRMEGLSKVRSGLTNMFLGAETTLSEKAFYTSDDLSLLIGAMADALPSIKALLAPDFRMELRQKLEVHRKAARKPDDLENLERMVAEL
jgi:hypothetical protein